MMSEDRIELEEQLEEQNRKSKKETNKWLKKFFKKFDKKDITKTKKILDIDSDIDEYKNKLRACQVVCVNFVEKC